MSGITFGDVVVVLFVVRAVCATLFTRASQLPRSGGVHEGTTFTTGYEDCEDDITTMTFATDDYDDKRRNVAVMQSAVLCALYCTAYIAFALH